MATFQRFEDIEAWQKGRELTQAVYQASRNGAFSKDFDLRDQIRKACISITSNIAEGFERNSIVAFHHFLVIAKGSAGEVKSQLYVALGEDYIDQTTFDRLYGLATTTIRQTGGLMRYLRKIRKRNQERKPS